MHTFFITVLVMIVAVFIGVIWFIIWWENSAVHYATSPYTYCGQPIMANGVFMIHHTTIEENVTCWSCKSKLTNERNDEAT